MRPKSIKALMKNMRDNKNIKISYDLHKKDLRYMGYFHGYKGYRYYSSPSKRIPYNDFSELKAVYDFDMNIKSILYSQIMFLETAIKNYVLEIILDECKSDSFTDVYDLVLNDYKEHKIGSKNYKQVIKKRMDVRSKVYSVISRDYGKNNIVNHYYDKDSLVPIWAIFELLSLGEFGNLLARCNLNIRKKASASVGIKSSVDSDGRMLELIVYTLKDLRNAVAHNNTIFDTRFKTGSINNRISKYISAETGIKNISFNSIVDYIILISFMRNLLDCSNADTTYFINQFRDYCEQLKKNVPANIFNQIIYTDTKTKLNLIKNFVNFKK